MKINSSFKHSPAATFSLFALLILLMAGFLLWPTWRSIAQISREISADRAWAASMEEQDVVVADFMKKYPDYQAGLESIGSMFVDTKNPVTFFEFIERTARLFDVQAAIQLAPKADGKITVDMFQITVKNATFENVARFSKALENGPHAISLMKIEVKNALAEGEKVSAQGVEANIIVGTIPK